MSYSSSSISWLRVICAGAGVVATSFLLLMAAITVYAFGLAISVRGAPDQHAINHFAATVSVMCLPWLEVGMTFITAAAFAPKARGSRAIQGLLIGIIASIFGLTVSLAFGAHLGFRTLAFVALGVGAGLLGGLIRKGRTEENAKVA
jgi:hypothetical protein